MEMWLTIWEPQTLKVQWDICDSDDKIAKPMLSVKLGNVLNIKLKYCQVKFC